MFQQRDQLRREGEKAKKSPPGKGGFSKEALLSAPWSPKKSSKEAAGHGRRRSSVITLTSPVTERKVR